MGWIKSEEGQKRRAKFDKEYKEEMSGGWQEKQIYNIADAGIEEVQSAKCPHCKKILTTPYLYSFDEFPFCPSCGKRVSDKPTAEPHEIKRERFVVMRNNRTEIWAGLAKNYSFRRLDDVKEVSIKTYRSERQAKTCSSWGRDFEVVPVAEIIRFKEGDAEREKD